MKLKKICFLLLALTALTPFMKASFALLLGILFSFIWGNPFESTTKKYAAKLLSLTIIGLGAGMNLAIILEVGKSGFLYTLFGILFTFFLGHLLKKYLKLENQTALLITTGTAICGGSAIATVAPILKAKAQTLSIALGTVFILNACALIIFPLIGHTLNLTQTQFGLWSALAIHDTSSVVGATLPYGAEALKIATTVKLTRALWIIPLALTFSFWVAKAEKTTEEIKASKIPWFIFGFLLMATLVTFIPELRNSGKIIEGLSKQMMVLILFLIGANVNKKAVKEAGLSSILYGVSLWFTVSTVTLGCILLGWIH